MNVTQLQQRFDDAKASALALHARLSQSAKAEGRDLGPGEHAALAQATREAMDLKHRLARAESDNDMTAAITRLEGGSIVNGSIVSGGAHGGSLGAQFIRSETYEWLREHRGRLPAGNWTSASSELVISAATLTEDSASGGALVVPHYKDGIVALPQRALTIADLIAPGTTDSNLILYMKEKTFTNAAATVAEAGPKPESTLVFETTTDPVRKIAHWLPVTEELLEDSSAARSFIDMRLRLGVQLQEDTQLLSGTTTPPDVVGFLNRTVLATSIARTTDTIADVVLTQIMAIWIATGLQPDGIVMNPAQWKTVLLNKDSTGNYIGGSPFNSPLRPSLWGLPIAITPAIPAGTALIGCFRTAAQLFRRGGIRVEASNSHASFFTSNLVAIRAEERLALCVYRPACFGTVTNLN